MRIAKTLALIVVLLIGGFALYHRDEISGPGDLVAVIGKQLDFRSLGNLWHNEPEQVATSTPSDRIKVASFKMASGLGPISKDDQLRMLADLCLDFDVIAIQQNVSDVQQFADLVAVINQRQNTYRYVRDFRGDGYAILFNTDTISLDSDHFYSVNDPENLFEHPPLVGWFRAKLAPAQASFTFTLANYQTRQELAEKEAVHLDALFRALRDDGRGEDDIVIVGDFVSHDEELLAVSNRSDLFQLVGSHRNVPQSQPADKILFHKTATVELGRSGVVELMRRYNLRVTEAQQISERNPVWIEFSIFEGQTPPPRPIDEDPFQRRRPQSPISSPSIVT